MGHSAEFVPDGSTVKEDLEEYAILHTDHQQDEGHRLGVVVNPVVNLPDVDYAQEGIYDK